MPRHSAGGSYVCTSSRAYRQKCARAEIKEACADEISMHVEEDQLDLGAAENFVMDPVEKEQNRRHSLRNTRKSARRQENGEQARRQSRNVSLRSRRHQESAEQMKQRRQARNDNLRLWRQQERAEQLEQLRQARRESDRQRRQRQ